MPLLDDILYPNEKDLLAEKYRLALDSIGTVVRNMQPKQKGKVCFILSLLPSILNLFRF